MVSASESAQRRKSELRFGNGECRSFQLEPSVPTNRGAIELVGADVGE
jgi:hypothetical protein